MNLLMFTTIKSISYESKIISDDFEAAVSWKLGIAYFPVGRVRQPYVKNSLDTAETAILLKWFFYWFLSIS